MRHRFLVCTSATVIAAAASLWLAVATATAQAPAYRAPRTADGRPDLNGIWQTLTKCACAKPGSRSNTA